jgi:hypothetical protein
MTQELASAFTTACRPSLARAYTDTPIVDNRIPGGHQLLPRGAGPEWTATRVPAGKLCACAFQLNDKHLKPQEFEDCCTPQARSRAHNCARSPAQLQTGGSASEGQQEHGAAHALSSWIFP